MSKSKSESELCTDKLLHLTSRAELSLVANTIDDKDASFMINEIQLYIHENKSLLPSYIIKKAVEACKKLENHLNSGKPTSRFKFKSAKSKSQIKSVCLESSNQGNTSFADDDQYFFGFRNLDNQDLSLSEDEVDSKDIRLVNLKNCTILLKGFINTVYIKNLDSCRVEVILSSRAISIIDCNDCTFDIVCHQLRINTTKDCDLNLFVSSRSMLESSKNLTYSKLEFKGDKHGQLFSRAGFNPEQNNWKLIDDFDCLNPKEKSGNIRIID